MRCDPEGNGKTFISCSKLIVDTFLYQEVGGWGGLGNLARLNETDINKKFAQIFTLFFHKEDRAIVAVPKPWT
jgi:hypothetical protein